MGHGTISRRAQRAGVVAAALAVSAALVLAAAPTPAWAAGRGRDAAARARRDLLGRSSFPAGWTSSPNPVTGDSQLLAPHRLARCAGVPPRQVPAHPPAATGPELALASGGLSAGEQVQVYPTTADATAAVDVVAARRAPSCAEAALNRPGAGSRHGARGRYSVAPLAVPRAGAQAAALAVTLALHEGGRTVSTSVDDVVVRSGRTVATLTLTTLGQPFPTALARHLEAEAARRIA